MFSYSTKNPLPQPWDTDLARFYWWFVNSGSLCCGSNPFHRVLPNKHWFKHKGRKSDTSGYNEAETVLSYAEQESIVCTETHPNAPCHWVWRSPRIFETQPSSCPESFWPGAYKPVTENGNKHNSFTASDKGVSTLIREYFYRANPAHQNSKGKCSYFTLTHLITQLFITL